jgi:hypothetical protein
MSNVFAIHSVGESLRTHLDRAYPADLRAAHACEFRLVSSGELANADEIDGALTLYLYRVTVNEHLRNARKPVDALRDVLPLSLELHFLLTAWSRSALTEHTVLAWAMAQLQQHPVLDQSSLSPEAAWGPDDVVQLVPAELSVEDMMRIWDALVPPYRLSVSYVARVVRIDTEPTTLAPPVVATRFRFEQLGAGGAP